MKLAGALLALFLLAPGQGRAPQSDREPSPASVRLGALIETDTLADSQRLLNYAHTTDPHVQTIAIRALGNRRDGSLTRLLLPFLQSESDVVRDEAVGAVVQSLRAEAEPGDPELVAGVQKLMMSAASQYASWAIGQLPYTTVEDVKTAERFLADPSHPPSAWGLEALARRNPKLASFDPETIDRLAAVVKREAAGDQWYASLAALIAAHALDADTARVALEFTARKLEEEEQAAEVRRLATAALAAGTAPLSALDRSAAVARLLNDPWYTVRYEAVRAYARREAVSRGCAPIVSAIRDASLHVVLAALDALGQSCSSDDSITDRLVAESRTPPPVGSWQREAHAFVALARRAPDRAAISMPAFRTHPLWQVRMYAARAADAMKDLVSLQILAQDANDNVVEATLGPLRRHDPADAEGPVIAALKRADYQLLRTAALLIKDFRTDPRLVAPLADTLARVTKEGKDTSRDTRLALIDAIRVHAQKGDASTLRPLLKDYDEAVVQAAAVATRALTDEAVRAAVVAKPRPALGPLSPTRAIVRMKSGATFELDLYPDRAPLAVARFIRLVHEHYFDGLSFHRVVPNFVIQGGSPGANEYAGDKDYMRDEIGVLRNIRGSVGVSTRGANTGDAQFYINLVTNQRLDGDFTIFANVTRRPDSMPVVDQIAEGDEIQRIEIVPR